MTLVGSRGSGWLVGLLLATFVIGTDDFIIAGILPAIAGDLGVSEAAAGQLVTVFSLTYAVAAPVLAVVAAAVSPAAFAVAGSLAKPERVGRAIGTVAAGLTVSLVVGVPLGAWISEVFDWRATFVTVGILTSAAAFRLPNWPLTTRVTDRWTFTGGADGKPLPLLDVEYDLPLGPNNAAPAGKELTGALRITHQVGAHRSTIRSVGLEVSYDDGATWHRAETARDGGEWTVRIPPGTPAQKFASLRTTATDAAGNSVTETLIRAYQLT